MSFEVETPIVNSPFEEPKQHWKIRHGEIPVLAPGRRRAVVYQPPEQREEWDLSDGSLAKAGGEDEGAYTGRTYDLVLVNRIRERVHAWREAGYPGATRTTRDLIDWWHRDGQQYPLFFAQREAALTIVFLKEARADFLQGIAIPSETLTDEQVAAGARPIERLACKMATGSGKTTVMAMLASWSILNKIADRTSRIHADAVLVVCPNVTIRDRLRELDPTEGHASIYVKRGLVPPALLPHLARGRVLVTNWHVFEPQSTQGGSRVVRAGVRVETAETVVIGDRNTTARGSRYMTREAYQALVTAGEVFVRHEELDGAGLVKKAKIVSWKYVESDAALIHRVLDRELGRKQNILVFNDEAHHAYRITQGADAGDDAESLSGTAEEDDDLAREATVWVEGLDRVNAHRGINFAVDLSATPYFLARAGRDTARPFPWTVSDFGLVDAIESGLVKIPQLPVRDTTGAEQASYFNIWEWIKGKLTAQERGGRSGTFRPEAVLKYAAQPITMLAGHWRDELVDWRARNEDRPPVFIIVCKDTKLAKVVHEWIADDRCPEGIHSLAVPELRNTADCENTIRVDSKVVNEVDASGDAGEAKGGKAGETAWMRFTMATVGRRTWPEDPQGRPVYPAGFEELAHKLGRPLDPPGRDVRCIVSVGMLTEGWDANTVTHIVGLRPFMSQLLCEQVVGRGLRRASYDVDEHGHFTEEVAQVFGVPFEVIPFKGSGARPAPKPKRFHVKAVPERLEFEIRFPRVIGYTQAVRNRVTVDWRRVPKLPLTPGQIPPSVSVGSLTQTDQGRITTRPFGAVREVTMAAYRVGMRHQEGVFRMARELTRGYLESADTRLPAHVLFPQVRAIVERFARECVVVPPGSDSLDLFTSPYYGWALEILRQEIQPDLGAGETAELPRCEPEPGTTAKVDFWTSRPVREVNKSHVNYVVADTARWEQQAAYYIDKHAAVAAFVKNSGLGFAIPYQYNGQPHDFIPDFLIRLAGAGDRYLILETKGFDPLAEVKRAAALRWVNAVNADGGFGVWRFEMARQIADVSYILSAATTVEDDALKRAIDYGIDLTLLEANLRLTPDQRLRALDEDAEFLGALKARSGRRPAQQ